MYERFVGFAENVLKTFSGMSSPTKIFLEETQTTVNNRPSSYTESNTTPCSLTVLKASHLVNRRICSTLPHLEGLEDERHGEILRTKAGEINFALLNTTSANVLQQTEVFLRYADRSELRICMLS